MREPPNQTQAASETCSLSLRLGETAVIRQTHLAGAGYLWMVESCPQGLQVSELASAERDGPAPKEPSIGGPGPEWIIAIRSTQELKGVLRLRLCRPWIRAEFIQERLIEIHCHR